MTDPTARNGLGSETTRLLLRVLTVTIAYVVTGRMGLAMADVQANTTLIWPPTGLSIGALVLFGPRMAIGVFAGAFLTNLSLGTPVATTLAITVGNTLEALVGWRLLTRLDFDPALERTRDVGLLLVAALAASLVSATIGVGALALGGAVPQEAFGALWLRWWAGDAAGAMIVLPLVTVAAKGSPSWRALARRPEAWLLLLATNGAASAAFLAPPHPLADRVLPFLPILFLVWSGLRLGPRGTVVLGALASLIAVVGTAQGVGPFAAYEESTRALLVWGYITTLGGLALVLATAVSEREAALERVLEVERVGRALEHQMQHVQRLESLGVLAGGVAHDFNNLLTVILVSAELLEDEPEEIRRRRLLSEIETTAKRASALCDQLLTYAGEARPDQRSIDLVGLAEEMGQLLRTTVARNIRLEIDLAPDTPPVAGDASLLRQILLNLLLNASEAIGEDDGVVRVEAQAHHCSRAWLDSTFLPSDAPEGPYVALVVSDDGPGMDEETLARVFEPFFSTKFTGRGLGLAAVLGAVQAQGGAIKVTSAPGQGTRFTVLLPLAHTAPEAEAEAPEVTPASGRWLVVDDEEAIRSLAAHGLGEMGAQVVQAADGDEALAWLEQNLHTLDGALFDLKMPGRNGKALLEWVRERRRGLPLVLMSGYTGNHELPADIAFLPKPFTLGEMSAAVERACAQALSDSPRATPRGR